MQGPTQPQCSGITKAGSRCKSWALPDSEFCITHDPNRITDLAEYRLQGGKGKSNEARAIKSVGGLRDLRVARATMTRILGKLEKGEIEPGVATAMATVVRALDAVTKTTVLAELDERMAEMSQQIATLNERQAG